MCFASMGQNIPRRYIDRLQSTMELNGYQFLPEWNQYRQPFPGGFRSIILSVTVYEEGRTLEAHLGIRIHGVEQLVYPLLNMPSGFRDQSMTLVTPLNKVMGEETVREIAESIQDEDRLLLQMHTQLNKKGFSFLRQCSSIKALDELFNEQPMQHLMLINNQYHRCFRGLVLAHLAQRKDFNELVAIYRSQLFRDGAIEPIRNNYEKLVSFLESYSPN